MLAGLTANDEELRERMEAAEDVQGEVMPLRQPHIINPKDSASA